MRMRKTFGLALATAALAGMSSIGAVNASAISSPAITTDECTAAGGQITSRPYADTVCKLPDGTTQPVT